MLGRARTNVALTIGVGLTPIQIVNQAEKRIPLEFAGEPELQAELIAAIQAIRDRIESKSP